MYTACLCISSLGKQLHCLHDPEHQNDLQATQKIP